MPKMVNLGSFFWITWSLQSNSVTRHVRLYRTKMGGKYQNTKNSNATFWVILKQCDACCIALNHFWICLNHFWIDSKAVCITFESFFERFSYLVPGWGFCAATSLFSFLALSQRDSDLTFTLMHFPGFKVTSKSLKVGPKRLKKVAFLGFHIFAHFSRQLKWSSFSSFIFAIFFGKTTGNPVLTDFWPDLIWRIKLRSWNVQKLFFWPK